MSKKKFISGDKALLYYNPKRTKTGVSKTIPTGNYVQILQKEDYTVGWICAIATEYVASQAFLDEICNQPECIHPHQNNDYTLGSTMLSGLFYLIANTTFPLQRG